MVVSMEEVLGPVHMGAHHSSAFLSSFQGYSLPRLRRYPSKLSNFSVRRFMPICITTESMVGDTVASSLVTPPIRRLILLRHAHSTWSDRTLKDHDRPLSNFGRLAAASIADKLQQVGWFPELILCSDSMRTRQTLLTMQEHAPVLATSEVHFLGSYYSFAAMDGQTAAHLRDTICKYSRDDIFTVMCMGHNRGWEEAATIFSGTPIELKTANAALLESQGDSWQEAFDVAGYGGWKLSSVVKPEVSQEYQF